MLVALFKLLSRLPLGSLQAIGAALGWAVYLASPGYRRRLRANLAQAGLDVAAVRRAAVAAAGRQSLETAWVWFRPPAQVRAAVTWVEETVLADALASPHPVLMLTPHLGCFEVIAQAYALRAEAAARPMTALYRVPRKAVLRPLLEAARARPNLRLAPADMRGVRMLLRALKQREVLGILPDQVPAQGEGVWAPFFGRPAYTMTLPARLARAGAQIVLLLVAERLPRGAGFRIHVEPLGERLTGDAEHDAAAINRGIERVVRRFPAQYLWGYNRYKAPANAPAAPAPAAQGVRNAD